MLVVYLGVGNMPPQRVKDYAAQVKKDMQETLGPNLKIMIFPQPEERASRVETLMLYL